MALLRWHNWRLWVCIYLCLCVWGFCVWGGGIFFPFKSCCRRRRRSRCERKASMRSSFVFHFTFRVTFSANCSLLTVANPGWAKSILKPWVGGGEGRAPSARMLGFPFLPLPDPEPTRPAAHPWKTMFPSTHRAQAETRHPDGEAHPPRARHSRSRLALADSHLSAVFPVCRPLTTGAIFVS